jgi:cyclophilin family peptidyl-prolyl cis-trans isomerase
MKKRATLILAFAMSLMAAGPALSAEKDATAGKKDAPAVAQKVLLPPGDGPKLKEFRRLHREMNEVLAKLRELQIRYQTADQDKQADIQSEWKDEIARGEKIEPKLIAAAEAAYAEAPNASKPIAEFLLMLLHEKVENDEYELAAEIGKLLMENHCPSKSLPNLAGIAAFAVSDFDAAEKYFAEAKRQDYYKTAAKDNKLADRGFGAMQQVPYYKEIWPREATLREHEGEAKGLPRVVLKTTKGDIVVELFENQAPNTVANFISLVQSGFYKDTPFHRVIQGFMAQGGDPSGTGSGGPGYTIPCECYLSNHRDHFRGSLSMAHTERRDSGGSQFFLTFVPTAHLDGIHTVFGRVIEGMDVLAKIQRRDPTDAEASRADKILEAKVLWKRNHAYMPQKIMN